MAKLGDICTFYSGTGFPVKYQGNTMGKYPFYKVGDIAKNALQGFIFLNLCENYIDETVCKTIKGTIIPKNTVVFAKIGEAVKLNRRAITAEECLIDNNAMGIKPNDSLLELHYFYHFMCRLKLEEYAETTTVPSVKKTVVEKIDIPLPPLETQRQIAATLDKVTHLIDLCKQQLETLDLLVKSRFIEMFGEPDNNPMHWTETTVGKECYYIKDGPHKSLSDIGKENGGHPFISVRNIVNHTIDFTSAKYISDEDYAEARKKCCPEKGDMLYSKGGTTGIAKLIDVDVEFANWVHIAVLKFDKHKLNGIFFENMLNCDYCYEQSQRLTKGIANRDLVLSAMAKIKMYLPPLDLQEQFAAFVESTDKSKLAVQKQLETLETLKKSLMQEYFG